MPNSRGAANRRSPADYTEDEPAAEAAADVAGAASLAGNRAVAPAGRRRDPPARRRAAAAVPRSHRAAGDQRFVLSTKSPKVAGVPVGTVMSRLARARSMLRAAWNVAEGADAMNCAECEILLHALIDGELDAGHARDVEAHATGCPACAEKLRPFAPCARRWPRPT